MRLLLARGWRVLLTPYRAFRQRISVQLIVSHLLVALLTILVINGAVIATLYGLVPQRVWGDSISLDGTLGEKARAVTFLLDADTVERAAQTNESSAERASLTSVLTQVIDMAPGEVDPGAGSAQPPPLVLDRVAHALIADPTGTIVASSHDEWASPGQSVETATFPLVPKLTHQAIALQGDLLFYQERYLFEVLDQITVATYPVLTNDGRLAGVVTLQSEPLDLSAFPARAELVREYIRASLGEFWAIIVVLALLVSIPAGVWRARGVSRRLSRLAAAADAMAEGDLSRRVPVTSRDEIGRLSERFNDMVDRLAATDRARRAFIANVSHELRTPVAIIQGSVERLLTRPRNGAVPDSDDALPSADTALGVIHHETLTLSRLIDDLFTLTRLEETVLPLETTSLAIQEVVSQAVEGLRTLAWEQRKVTVQSLVSPDLPPILADRTRLRQILNNLLYNALRNTPEGGLIIVDATKHAAGSVVEIAVTDTGIGIAEEELANVFNRFYRANHPHRQDDGAGLGLSIVKQLVEAQGGAVSVESTPTRGTTFRFTLPTAQPPRRR